jgi:hypothetical protein
MGRGVGGSRECLWRAGEGKGKGRRGEEERAEGRSGNRGEMGSVKRWGGGGEGR